MLVCISMCGFTDVTIQNQTQISVVLQIQSQHFWCLNPGIEQGVEFKREIDQSKLSERSANKISWNTSEGSRIKCLNSSIGGFTK